MEEMDVVYYDAHVRTYQRYLLLSWLESAKTERIREVKKQIIIPKAKVKVPDYVQDLLSMPQETEEEKEKIQKKFNVSYVDIVAPSILKIA